MQQQIARRLIAVGARWCCVAMGAVLLGNAIADCWTPWQESAEKCSEVEISREKSSEVEISREKC